MNKILSISLVSILGIAGGGAYMLMESDKDLADYVPESVSSLIGEYIPGFSSGEVITISDDDMIPVSEQSMQNAKQIEVAPEAQVVNIEVIEATSMEAASQKLMEEPIKKVESATQSLTQAQKKAQAQAKRFQEIAKAKAQRIEAQRIEAQRIEAQRIKTQQKQPVVAQEITELPAVVEKEINNPGENDTVEVAMKEIQESINDAPQVAPVKTSSNPIAIKISKKIELVNGQISQIDLENKRLKEKFQKILRKNRDLVKKLQAIDKEISDAG